MYKGIFLYDPSEQALICKKVLCDADGAALADTEYSSKSGENFNHKAEWATLPKSMTNGHPYNYYPRGRVEIKKGKASVYLNPVLNTERVTALIKSSFELGGADIHVKMISDGSEHYRHTIDDLPRMPDVKHKKTN